MYCKNCGADMPENSKFCVRCGTAATTAAPPPVPQYQAPPPPPPQPYPYPYAQRRSGAAASKKVVAIIVVVFGLLFIGSIVAITLLISYPSTIMEITPLPIEIITPEPVEIMTPEPVEIIKPEPTQEATSEATPEPEETKRVGSDTHGYISIPDSWMKFVDLDPMPGVIQFTDGAGTIISLNYYDAQLDIDIQTSLSNIAAGQEDKGADDVQGATVTLNGETAYQIYCYFPDDGIFLIVWMFEGPGGNVQYIAVEGPGNTVYDAVQIIEQTFSFEQ